LPYSATIETQSDEPGQGDGYHIENIGISPEEFIAKARRGGGAAPFHNGAAPFIPWAEITQIFFDDGSPHVCEHCQEEPTPEVKDLTVN
jgi:hypothetical protein